MGGGCGFWLSVFSPTGIRHIILMFLKLSGGQVLYSMQHEVLTSEHIGKS